jgi:hypothetical protein
MARRRAGSALPGPARRGSANVRWTMLVLANYSFQVTFVAILLWVILFPVLVQGLIAYAVIVARGEKRQNEEYRRRRLEG